jgi:hypothetical protein
MWIFGKPLWDALLIFAPGLVGLALSASLPAVALRSGFYAFLALGFTDSGHVYSTVWRTWLNPAERRSSPRYWQVPLFFFMLILLWYKLNLPYMWAFVVYYNIYHHVKQFYGILRWYEKLNGRRCRVSHLFFNVLTWGPLLLYHFRPGALGVYYVEREMFLWPQAGIFAWGVKFYLGVLVAWLGFELSLWKRGVREQNRAFAIGLPAVIYSMCLLVFDRRETSLFPLLFAHGMTYLGILSLSLRRTRPTLFPSALKVAFVVLATAFFLGGFEDWFAENVVHFNAHEAWVSWAQAAAMSAVLTPPLCHFVFDAYIWRGDHREAAAVYAAVSDEASALPSTATEGSSAGRFPAAS